MSVADVADGSETPPRGAAVRLLARVTRRSPGWLALMVLVDAGGAVAVLLLPAFLGVATDAILTGGPLAGALSLLGAVLAGSALSAALSTVAGSTVSANGTAWLRRATFGHLLSAGLVGPRRFSAGDLSVRLLGDAGEAGSVAPLLVDAAVSAMLSIGGLVALWLIDWRLAVVFVAAAPVVAILTRVLVRRVTALDLEYDQALARLAGRLSDAVAGARTIRAAGTRHREAARVLVPLADLSRSGHQEWAVQRRASWQIGLLGPLLQILVLATAGFQLAAGRISAGDFLAAAGYTQIALGLLDQVAVVLGLAEIRVGARRLADLFALPRTRYGSDPLPLDGTLDLIGVTVRRFGRSVLRDVYLRVPDGTSVAVVGRSGAGKSTLALLAGRLIDPDEGVVRLGGRSLAGLDHRVLRREIGYAFERPELLGETISECLGYGRPELGLPALQEAARLAHVDDFVSRLPDGYATRLEDTPLSGGEQQRLGLARALAQGRRLLILDDAMSSLDVATEALVSAALTDRANGRTRLVIAHRAATAARAHLVVWLDAGQVRALAPHRTLWSDPQYRALFSAVPDPSADGTR
jgi:ATP-binding cassette, subfamily B, bacterial